MPKKHKMLGGYHPDTKTYLFVCEECGEIIKYDRYLRNKKVIVEGRYDPKKIFHSGGTGGLEVDVSIISQGD